MINTRIAEANVVLHELYCSVTTNRELSNTPKRSVFKYVFVPFLTYGHESWVMIEKILSQVQEAEMGFLRRDHGVTLRDQVRSRENRRALNVEPFLLRIERSPLRWFGHVSRIPHERLARQVWLSPRESGTEVVQGPGGESGYENQWIVCLLFNIRTISRAKIFCYEKF